MLAVSDQTWTSLISAAVVLMLALAGWLRGEYKDWKISREAKQAKDACERAASLHDALCDKVAAPELKSQQAPEKEGIIKVR